MKTLFQTTLLVLAAFFCVSASAGKSELMLATPLFENGQPVSLEVVVYTPPGAGPFPVLLFNHGSTGRGDDRALFARTTTSDAITTYFNDMGWAVVYPQRRGRGKSGGLYDEGFEADRSRYSCDPARSLPGLERAMEDLDAIVPLLKERKELDTSRMLIGGQSRGGILAVVYAGRHPEAFAGVVNFVGGWMSDKCPRAAEINHVSYVRGAAFKKPTLWLYGENDPFYAIEHTRAGFEAFKAGGGLGSYQQFKIGLSSNGHALVNHPRLWREALDAYMAAMKPAAQTP